MSDNKWTPEPWGVKKHPRIENFRYADWQPQDAIKIAYVVPKPDYDHAFECVNALAGVENPDQFVGMAKNYLNEDKEIRKVINADENESTYDEVVRMMKQREELAEQVKKLKEYLDQANAYIERNSVGL